MLDLKPTTLCPALYKWSIKAAAMLRTQAAEIESLKVEYVKELDKVSERNYSLRKENESLKADAERYKWLKANCALGIKQNGNGWSLSEWQCDSSLD